VWDHRSHVLLPHYTPASKLLTCFLRPFNGPKQPTPRCENGVLSICSLASWNSAISCRPGCECRRRHLTHLDIIRQTVTAASFIQYLWQMTLRVWLTPKCATRSWKFRITNSIRCETCGRIAGCRASQLRGALFSLPPTRKTLSTKIRSSFITVEDSFRYFSGWSPSVDSIIQRAKFCRCRHLRTAPDNGNFRGRQLFNGDAFFLEP